MQFNIISSMYIIGYVQQLKHTWVLARSMSGTVFYSLQDDKTKIFGLSMCSKGTFLNKHLIGKYDGKTKKANSKCWKKLIQGYKCFLMSLPLNVCEETNKTYRQVYSGSLVSEAEISRSRSAGISGVKLKEVTKGSMNQPHILVRHLGP